MNIYKLSVFDENIYYGKAMTILKLKLEAIYINAPSLIVMFLYTCLNNKTLMCETY